MSLTIKCIPMGSCIIFHWEVVAQFGSYYIVSLTINCIPMGSCITFHCKVVAQFGSCSTPKCYIPYVPYTKPLIWGTYVYVSPCIDRSKDKAGTQLKRISECYAHNWQINLWYKGVAIPTHNVISQLFIRLYIQSITLTK